jgi:hypothetical protein
LAFYFNSIHAAITSISTATTEFEQEASKWQKQYNTVSWIRVLVFLAGIAGTIILYQYSIVAVMIVAYALLSLVTFLFFMKKHNRIAYTRDQYRYLTTNQQR